jgi:mono/diheme cytochrome c family protein
MSAHGRSEALFPKRASRGEGSPVKAHVLRIVVFVLAVVGAYAWIGQLLPQFEEHPPAKKTIAPDMPADELVAIGEELVRGKGGCLVCHKVTEVGNERGPDLRKSAALAATRRSGMDAQAYLLEALVDPGAFVAAGYPNMMPSALKPPANFSMAEVKAAVAYMQALAGAEVTVKVLAEDLRQAAVGPMHAGRALFARHGCQACHRVAGEGGEIGPDLTRVAAAREPAEILRKIAEPAAWLTPGYPAGLMPAGNAIPEGERHEIVAWLATLAGKSYSATGAASPWSHEGVRLGVVIAFFNVALLAALALASRRERQP